MFGGFRKTKSDWRQTTFNAVDGLHHASVNGIVSLQMIDVLNIKKRIRLYLLDTGSASRSGSR
jgi:diaminopimelate epimerase